MKRDGMRIRIDIEPNDLVREAQKQKRSMDYDQAKSLLKENSEFLGKSMSNLKQALLKTLIGEKS
jgi:hypothetical protein